MPPFTRSSRVNLRDGKRKARSDEHDDERKSKKFKKDKKVKKSKIKKSYSDDESMEDVEEAKESEDESMADVDEEKSSKPKGPQRPPRQPRWTHDGEKPLVNWDKLPDGWNPNEPDLAPTDFDAQIERCRERIADNIMPHIFHEKLKVLKDAKKERDEIIASEPSGLDSAVVQRLHTLKKLLAYLEEKEDPHKQVPNVEAIMKQYRSGGLKWYGDGQVTYWSHGYEIGRVRQFDWDEYFKLSEKHQGYKGFWVEGLNGPGPEPQMILSVVAPPLMDGPVARSNNIKILLSLPGQVSQDSQTPNPPMPQLEFDFIDDTGASAMTIFRDDLKSLVPPGYMGHTGGEWPWPHIMGYGAAYLADGSMRFYLIVGMLVNMWGADLKPPPLAPGVPPLPPTRGLMRKLPDLIQCFVYQDLNSVGPYGFLQRSNGPWLRHTMYTATAPNQTHEMIISQSGRKAGSHFPAVKPSSIRAPDVFIPDNYAVNNPMVPGSPVVGDVVSPLPGGDDD